MAKQLINLGTAPSGSNGDTQRVANIKVNANFDELYRRQQGALPKDISGAAGVVAMSADEALYGFIFLTGTITGNRQVAVPDGLPSLWTVVNSTSGNFSVTFRTSSGVGVAVPAGGLMLLASNGVNVFDAASVAAAKADAASAKVDALTTALDAEIGRVSFFATATVQAGYLECTGAAVLRADFPKLFNRIGTVFGAGNGTTTFNIPDLRGEFLRGWDHGRGIDASRVFASLQLDLLRSHYHNLRISQDSSGQQLRSSAGGATQGNASIMRMMGDDVSSVFPLYAAPDGSNMGAETRPRNVAMMPCIKC